jgi:hypothetical protein
MELSNSGEADTQGTIAAERDAGRGRRPIENPAVTPIPTSSWCRPRTIRFAWHPRRSAGASGRLRGRPIGRRERRSRSVAAFG